MGSAATAGMRRAWVRRHRVPRPPPPRLLAGSSRDPRAVVTDNCVRMLAGLNGVADTGAQTGFGSPPDSPSLIR